ncbi:hypothetical protein A5724_26570 [Mycobacterium sp. ACS1612]|nr:hypothetical protein A5724_26570 [Mycobacterium sp. ACS1612]
MVRARSGRFRVWTVLSRVFLGVLGAAAVVGAPGFATAEPPPDPPPQPPPPPNVNALAPVKLSDYAMMDGNWFAFSTPEGVICALQKGNGYGCSGPIPAAPEGANLVSAGYGGPAGFSIAPRNVFEAAAAAKPLPPGSRISYQTVSCGNDGATTTCVDSRSQSGFVLSPAGSFIINSENPLLYRPDNRGPFAN